MAGFLSRWRDKNTYSDEDSGKGLVWVITVLLVIYILVAGGLGIYWSQEPERFTVSHSAMSRVGATNQEELPRGYTFTSTVISIADTLLHKPGGYISNDVMPPGLILDNIKNWEYGALVTLRDASAVLRNYFSRSQSQSKEDPDLAEGEPFFNFQNNSWVLPSTEGQYQKGMQHFENYLQRLGDKDAETHFYARADNLRQYLEIVEQRLGNLAHRLSASATQYQSEKDQNDDSIKPKERTSWFKVDDNFYEARGSAWALLHIFWAIKHDFRDIIEKKEAMATLDNMIQELENALEPTVSPIVLNGDGFGVFANYSLTMANFIARANAAALNLRDLLMRG